MKQIIFAVLMLTMTSLAHAGITCSDYLADHNQLLPIAAKVLADKAPTGDRREIHISHLNIVIEHQCKQNPQRSLASVLRWFNDVIENEYDQVGGWLVFTPNGGMVFDNMFKS